MVVTVVPETHYIRMLRSSFKVKNDSPLNARSFLFCTTPKFMKRRKKITYCLPFYSFALTILFYSLGFNFIMRSQCQVSCKR